METENINVETAAMLHARKFLAERVKKSQKEAFAEVVEITPELAGKLLEGQINAENRPLSRLLHFAYPWNRSR